MPGPMQHAPDRDAVAVCKRLVEDDVGPHDQAAGAAFELRPLPAAVGRRRHHLQCAVDAGEEGIGDGGRTLVRDVGPDVEKVGSRQRRAQYASHEALKPLPPSPRVAQQHVQRLERRCLAARDLRASGRQFRGHVIEVVGQELVNLSVRVRKRSLLYVVRSGGHEHRLAHAGGHPKRRRSHPLGRTPRRTSWLGYRLAVDNLRI